MDNTEQNWNAERTQQAREHLWREVDRHLQSGPFFNYYIGTKFYHAIFTGINFKDQTNYYFF